MSELGEGTVAAARQWAADDPDPETRRDLERLIEAKDLSELELRMAAPPSLGTAGFRAIVGAGRARMNLANAVKIARGVADFVLARPGVRPSEPRRVLIGYDARIDSCRFAETIRRVLCACAVDVEFFAEPVPTPLVAFWARRSGADVALVVTASHNPPEYNGCKVYGSDGAQLAPPLDEALGRCVSGVLGAREIPLTELPCGKALDTDRIAESYVEELLAFRPKVPGDRSTPLVYTPLHGVGWSLVERVLSRAGYSELRPVPTQVAPDGRFPTLRFPNPELPGVLDLALEHARREHAELVLANDPDADRLAVAVPDGADGFRALSGDQIGVLLGDYLLRHRVVAHPLVLSTIVSSPMLVSIAEAYGARSERTLTGFKWVWSAVLELEASAASTFVYAYEEAIGYSVWPGVRDKDGISAALIFADLTAECRSRKQSVLERLEELEREYGFWTTASSSIDLGPGAPPGAVSAILDRLVRTPPGTLATERVARVVDYRFGAAERPRWLGTTPLVELGLEHGRALVRPSGTEPKLKIYVQLFADGHGDAASKSAVDLRARAAADAVFAQCEIPAAKSAPT